MLTYPHIDPVIASIGPIAGIGPLQLHWYGLMYLFGFVGAFWLGFVRSHRAGTRCCRRQGRAIYRKRARTTCRHHHRYARGPRLYHHLHRHLFSQSIHFPKAPCFHKTAQNEIFHYLLSLP